MQLLSCANLYAIIFFEVKCREVLVVVGGIVAILMHQNMKMMIRPGGNKCSPNWWCGRPGH